MIQVLVFLTYLINLSDNSVEDLSLEWPEDYSLILNRVHHKALPWLDQTSSYTVYCCHCYHETIPETRDVLLQNKDGKK